MAKILIILLVAFVFEAIGVVILKKGIDEVVARHSERPLHAARVLRMVGSGFTNRNILVGVFFETLFFIGLLLLMGRSDISFLWPLTSISFVLTTLAAQFYLRETVSGLRWSGVALIMVGAALITWSEKSKSKEPPQEPPAAGASITAP
ncbi:MAG: hypothetical protein EXS33_08670 [Pedosphaera sp.]|nr:hypothetical protein [Pedosphaera sp.]